jgi:uncharacterized secreted protein with C-terminal beta-propeller domain
VQKAGIDEPDIMKTNGTYIYYFDQTKNTIKIIDVKTQNLVNTIAVTKEFAVQSMLLQ